MNTGRFLYFNSKSLRKENEQKQVKLFILTAPNMPYFDSFFLKYIKILFKNIYTEKYLNFLINDQNIFYHAVIFSTTTYIKVLLTEDDWLKTLLISLL